MCTHSLAHTYLPKENFSFPRDTKSLLKVVLHFPFFPGVSQAVFPCGVLSASRGGTPLSR